MTGPTPASPRERHRLRVVGVVQGVGFRPFVHRLAHRLALGGWVRNGSAGVTIEAAGPTGALAAFRHALSAEAPPLARIDGVAVEILVERGADGGSREDFVIDLSDTDSRGEATEIPPDIALCPACLAELCDPADRRFGYPFVNCTDCGPRFTLILDTPYDRPETTMACFELCAPCAAEYHDPASRRFHAQPNACPVCGPRLWAERPEQSGAFGRIAEGHDAIETARQALAEGGIVAIKGVGGFHLACDATSATAVARLRRRKHRPHKPLALMAAHLDIVRRYVEVSEAEAVVLEGRDRPIVLLPRLGERGDLDEGVAPGQATLGFMLPYAPIHHLLLGEQPLVMTSGNAGGEPIVIDNDDARQRLVSLADLFLFHDRGIHQVCDDSVVRVFEDQPLPIRRARGHTPTSLELPSPPSGSIPPLLAVGGELKSVFALVRDGRAYASQHLGDMGSLETLEVFERSVEHFLHLFRVEPEAVVCDLHPGYLSSRRAAEWAAERGLPLLKVQHHHAHVAGLMAEHGLDGGTPVLGVSFDGTGYALGQDGDGVVWGGEVLLAGYQDFRRVAHLRPALLPGGDAAIQHPGRMALAHLHAAGLPWEADLPSVAALDDTALRVLEQQLERRLGTVGTTSMGRLFDAVASLADLRQEASFEGQPAMELEALVERMDDEVAAHGGYRFDIRGEPGDETPWVIDPRPVLRSIVEDVLAGLAPAIIADHFHTAVAEAVAETCDRLRSQSGISRVALTGGVFQNLVLLRRTVHRLRQRGLEPLVHRRFPPNDGGLAIGQAMIAGHRLALGDHGSC